MMYNVYDKKILAPAKCGSRYLDRVYGLEIGTTKKITVLPKGTKLNHIKSIPKIKEQFLVTEWRDWKIEPLINDIQWIVIRPPEEFTISAINTEFLLHWNSGNTLISDEKKLLDNILLTKQGHYDPTLFKQLYFFWSSSTVANNRVRFIHLKHLTSFAKEYLSFEEDLSKEVELHDFSNLPIFMNKKDLINYIKKVFPTEWSLIQKNMEIDTFFWDLIQKNCEFYEPKML